jgi:hypothetical protein
MRRLWLGVLGVIVSLGFVVPMASASPAQIVIRAREISTNFVQQGNTFSFSSVLKQSGAIVGSDAVTCHLGGQCKGEFTFNGEGTMFAHVPEANTNVPSFVVTISGGTGTFTRAHGTVTITSNGPNSNVSQLVFRITT